MVRRQFKHHTSWWRISVTEALQNFEYRSRDNSLHERLNLSEVCLLSAYFTSRLFCFLREEMKAASSFLLHIHAEGRNFRVGHLPRGRRQLGRINSPTTRAHRRCETKLRPNCVFTPLTHCHIFYTYSIRSAYRSCVSHRVVAGIHGDELQEQRHLEPGGRPQPAEIGDLIGERYSPVPLPHINTGLDESTAQLSSGRKSAVEAAQTVVSPTFVLGGVVQDAGQHVELGEVAAHELESQVAAAFTCREGVGGVGREGREGTVLNGLDEVASL